MHPLQGKLRAYSKNDVTFLWKNIPMQTESLADYSFNSVSLYSVTHLPGDTDSQPSGRINSW